MPLSSSLADRRGEMRPPKDRATPAAAVGRGIYARVCDAEVSVRNRRRTCRTEDVRQSRCAFSHSLGEQRIDQANDRRGIAGESPSACAIVHNVYGGLTDRPPRSGREAANILHSHSGIRLDDTYSAKAWVAALDECRSSKGPILYWLTFDAQSDELKIHIYPGDLRHGRKRESRSVRRCWSVRDGRHSRKVSAFRGYIRRSQWAVVRHIDVIQQSIEAGDEFIVRTGPLHSGNTSFTVRQVAKNSAAIPCAS